MSIKTTKKVQNFNKVTISLASPEYILQESYGEVLKPETINYRTHKPERDGLFCQRIFGPIKDYECSCGKYRRIRYKGIVCDKCGVEVTEKKVRRERIGHINLVVPVVHIWYIRSLPNKIGYLLGLPSKKLDLIVYYERYVVIQPGIAQYHDGTPLKHMEFLMEEEYLQIVENLPKENLDLDDRDPNKFIAKMGAECIEELLKRVNIDELSSSLRHKAENETSKQRRIEAIKRLQVVEAFRESYKKKKNCKEWMIIHALPVIPPELRPLVSLEGGRFATSDLNDLYRRIIIRNNRLKRLLQIKAPEIILRNEKRMLQEAVDSLYDNTKKTSALNRNRTFKSLSDSLKGKQGRFRHNLLGKRVDYSARSVIVVGPQLKLYECGLPKYLAAELYKPFIIRKLLERGIVETVKSAQKLVDNRDNRDTVVWEVLENVLKGHPVLLNRAPTLHRLGIQAFYPKLIEGKAIQLHPLVCTAFNADFDGDQMAVHLPLGPEAILEAKLLLLSSQNILNPANGSPITVPSQDMVLGLYYMTKCFKSTSDRKIKGEGLVFSSTEEVQIAYNEGAAEIHAVIKVKVPILEKNKLVDRMVETTVGRVLFNQVVPKKVGYINELLTKRSLRDIIGKILMLTNVPTTVKFLDDVKELGFYNSFKGGLSFSLGDLIIPNEKQTMINSAIEQIDAVKMNYNMGLITNNERYNQVIDIWTSTNALLTEKVMKQMYEDHQGFNSVYMMLDSGARGSKEQIRQLSGMRGLMAKPQRTSGGSGGSVEIIENPILSNFREGISILEYFISTHGARKGLADTAIKTADAGYLTRRLVDVAQDIIVTEEDCGTIIGIEISALKKNEEIRENLSERILGRIALDDIFHPRQDEIIVASDEMFDADKALLIEELGIETVEVRSPLTCESKRGICAKCYGRNLSTGQLVNKGEAVGVIAAQSIGEPGTQLTLRTFHVGGTAGNIYESNKIRARFDGIIEFEDIRTVQIQDEKGNNLELVVSRSTEMRLLGRYDSILMQNNIPYGATLFVHHGVPIKKGTEICRWDPYNAVIISEYSGTIAYEYIEQGINYTIDEQAGLQEKVIYEYRDKNIIPSLRILDKEGNDLKIYNIPVGAHLMVEDGEVITAGKIMGKIPRKYGKTTDITGGLPRATELCEARNPSNPGVISEIDGVVSFGNIKRGHREIIIASKSGDTKKYFVQLSNQIIVQENDYVKAGTALSEGAIPPENILNIKGAKEVQKYLVNEIQEIYRLQGVKINDKHFEIIVGQMMRKVQIIDSGDTRFLEESIESKNDFFEENERISSMKVVEDPGNSEQFKPGQIINLTEWNNENDILRHNGKRIMRARNAIPAIAKPVLQGITRASLQTKSFISAASFQETTKVLNEAAISGKSDYLLGLKENVIVGHKVPAGTGLKEYEKLIVSSKPDV